MEPDTSLVLGLAIGVLCIPAIVSSLSSGRRPRVAMLALMVSGVMVVYAISTKPGGYAIEDLPGVIAKVVRGFT